MPDQTHTFVETISQPAAGDESTLSVAPAKEPLHTALLDTEARFYRGYSWCLNAYPTLHEVVPLLRQHLNRLDDFDGGWQRAEVMTNVFLLSCAIMDTVDDYLLGERFDFSAVAAVVPGTGPILRAADVALKAVQATREWRLRRLHAWRRAWGEGVQDFLKIFVAPGEPDKNALLLARTRLASLLGFRFPAPLGHRRARVVAAFRNQDLTPVDILALGRRFAAAFPDRAQPVLAIGLRTAGSYFAPLLRAWLEVEGYRDPKSVTIRPFKSSPDVRVGRWEAEALARSARQGALALIVDEPLNTGGTLAKCVDLLRRIGFSADRVIALLPIHPTRREWIEDPELLSRSGIRAIFLEPEHYHKCQLLELQTVETQLAEYFRWRQYSTVRVLASPAAERLNRALHERSDEKFHTRLKRVFEVRLADALGRTDTRYVLAKSVGWGWLGYHAVIAGERLAPFVPPVLGLRDGILYTEWLPQRDDPGATSDRRRWMETAASYLAARVRTLSLTADPSSDLARTNQHRGVDQLASTLARAYGWKPVAFLKRARLRHELASRPCPVPTLIDAKLRPQEWVAGPRSLLKSDFEHHGQGKNELNVSDPAYDLAEAILYAGLSEAEEGWVINRYIKESADTGVTDRLFLNKLLAGTLAMNVALTNLADGRLSHRAREFNRLYLDAWNFLTVHTARLCGRMCGRPSAIRWRSPLVVLDIDGVLDKQTFGFPSTTSAGLQALGLLHAHGVAIAVNTARTLAEVKEYCQAYGLVGGVGEYGAVVWDAVGGQEQVLVSAESRQQLERVADALRQIPGVFLNDDYRYSIRAYTYERDATVPLPTLLIRDLIAGLRADRLDFHQTYLDTAIVAKEADKGKGLLALLGLVGHQDLDTIAVGDSEPDLAMFRVARRSFAPAQISCRSVARRLGCRIADRPYQAGLLSSVRSILHPDGRQCDRCRTGGRVTMREAGALFAELLEVADQRRVRLLLRTLSDPRTLRTFAK